MHTGDAARFNAFICRVAMRIPQHKEKIMTIADRLRPGKDIVTGLTKASRKANGSPHCAYSMLKRWFRRDITCLGLPGWRLPIWRLKVINLAEWPVPGNAARLQR